MYNPHVMIGSGKKQDIIKNVQNTESSARTHTHTHTHRK